MERIKRYQYSSQQPSNEDNVIPINRTSSELPYLPSHFSNNNRNLISPTDQRMNALNDQQTAEAAATMLNVAISSSPNSSTSRTCNNYNTTSSIQNVPRSGCDNHASTAEMTPLLYIQPATNHIGSIVNNTGYPLNRALLVDEQNEEGSINMDEGALDESNIISNAVA